MIAQEQIQRLVDVIVQETKAEEVYLFGSLAINEDREDSDVDLIVVLDEVLGKRDRR